MVTAGEPGGGRFAPGSSRARGDTTEALVVAKLGTHGLELVQRNAEQGGAEIDLIARTPSGDLYVFVEVRGRSCDAQGTPAQTVNARKQRQIIRAATTWLVQHDLWEQVAVRFDVVGVIESSDGTAQIEWIENAFEAGTSR